MTALMHRISHIKLKQNITVPCPCTKIHFKRSLCIPINRKEWNDLVPMQTQQWNCAYSHDWRCGLLRFRSNTHMLKGTVKRFPKTRWMSLFTLTITVWRQIPILNRWPLQSQYSGVETDSNIWIVQHTTYSVFNNSTRWSVGQPHIQSHISS